MPAMSSALSVRAATLPGANAIGNITASAASTRRPPPSRSLGFAEGGMAEAAHVPDLVQRDALEIEPFGNAGLRHRPRERGVEEDVRLDERAGRAIDEKAGRREHAIELGTPLESRASTIHRRGPGARR